MTEHAQASTPPSGPDGDGVRVTRKARSARQPALVLVLTLAVAVAAVLAWRVATRAPVVSHGEHARSAQDIASGPEALEAVPTARRVAPAPEELPELRNGDPNDLANYFVPGDPEPTGAELIEALQDVGIRTGIGAFNPPGTSPVLEGVAVPDEYVLPEGYARHHQWTDEGEPIGAILVYAPGFTHHGPDGNPIATPGNGVVPPHLAPPGL